MTEFSKMKKSVQGERDRTPTSLRDRLVLDIHEQKCVDRVVLSREVLDQLKEESCFPEQFKTTGSIYLKPYTVSNSLKNGYCLLSKGKKIYYNTV